MAARNRNQPGGILGLAEALDEPSLCSAVEAELIRFGLRLRWLCDGTDRLNWRDLHVIIREATTDSPVIAAFHPNYHGWDIKTHLLACISDILAGANWQRGGGKGERPKPIERPTDKQRQAENTTTKNPSLDESGTYLGETLPLSDMATWLGNDWNHFVTQ